MNQVPPNMIVRPLTEWERGQRKAQRDAVQSRRCRDCGAHPGDECRNQYNGLPLNDMVPGHPARIVDWQRA